MFEDLEGRSVREHNNYADRLWAEFYLWHCKFAQYMLSPCLFAAFEERRKFRGALQFLGNHPDRQLHIQRSQPTHRKMANQ